MTLPQSRPASLPALAQFALWSTLALATVFACFVLPFLVPLHEPMMSAAYTAGCNNRVAAVGVALVGLLSVLACWRWRLGPAARPVETQPLAPRAFWPAMAYILLFTAILGTLIVRRRDYLGDSGYFVNQLRTGLELHRHIFTQFEFPYGPILFWFPALTAQALRPLHISLDAAYVVALAALQILGLGLLFYVLQALPMRRLPKIVLFALITVCSQTPLFGINYSLFRFLIVPATLVLLSRRRTLPAAIAVAGFGQMLQLGVSPEMGVAFFGGVVAYACFRARTAGPRWLWLIAAAAAGIGLFVALAGPGYFLMLGKMGKGAYNLILEPLPHIMLFLVAAVVLAPMAVAQALRRPDAPSTAILPALYGAGLGLIPVALGRCDPLHVFFNAIPLYLLSFVAIDTASPRSRRLWIAAVAFIFVTMQLVNLRIYGDRLRGLLGPVRTSDPAQLATLERLVGPHQVSAPAGLDPNTTDDLIRTGQYQPGFYDGMLAIWNPADEQRLIANMHHAAYAIVPDGDFTFNEPIDNTPIKRLMRFGYTYRQKNTPYVAGLLIEADLKQNWVPVATIGPTILYRQRVLPAGL